MKVGVAIYYRNIKQYPVKWVRECIDSIRNQTRQDFSVHILDYSGTDTDKRTPQGLLFKEPIGNGHRSYHIAELENYAAAMNYLYEKIFKTCDIAVNVNIDDYYSADRLEIQLPEIENGNCDIVSSNFYLITKNSRIIKPYDFSQTDVYLTLTKGSINPVSNPAHCIHKRVFERLQPDPSLVPIEDKAYWVKCIEAGFRLKIVPEYLHYYRQHSMQATHTKDRIK